MMTARTTTAETRGQPAAAGATRPGVLRALQILAGALVLLVLNQAFLAGRGQFVDRDVLDIHGVMGALIFLLTLVQPALVLMAGIRGGRRRPVLAIALLLPILVFVQLGLGFAGRESGEAAAWHLPTGMLIFGLTVTNLWLTMDSRRAS